MLDHDAFGGKTPHCNQVIAKIAVLSQIIKFFKFVSVSSYLLLPAYITLSIYSPDGEVVGAEWLVEWLASQGGIGLEADVFR